MKIGFAKAAGSLSAAFAAALLFIAVGVSSAGAQADQEAGYLDIEVLISIGSNDGTAEWDFEVSSSQPGCSSRAVTLTSGPNRITGLATEDGDADLCRYTVTEIDDTPTGFIQIPSGSIELSASFPSVLIRLVEPDARGWIDTAISVPTTDASATTLTSPWQVELTSSQPGCTNETLPISELRDGVGGDRFEGVVVLHGVSFCEYSVAVTGLPEGWLQPDAVDVTYDLASGLWADADFLTYPLDSLSRIDVSKDVNGNVDDIPVEWHFELTSSQPGCTEATLSLPSDGTSSAYGSFEDVVPNDADGEPCVYVVDEVDLPDGWYQPSPQPVEVYTPRSGAVSFTNNHIASAEAIVELIVFSEGEPSLAPELYEFVFSSTCLAEPLTVQLPSRPTFGDDPSENSGHFREILVPLFDTEGEPCSYTTDPSSDRGSTIVVDPATGRQFVSYYRTFYADDPAFDDPGSYVSQPADPAPTSVPVVSTPTVVATGQAESATAAPVVAAAPAAVAPIVAAVAAPAPVITAPVAAPAISGATYGFSNSLPEPHVAAATTQPQLALTGSESGSLTAVATMLVLAGVVFFAVSRAPRRRRS